MGGANLPFELGCAGLDLLGHRRMDVCVGSYSTGNPAWKKEVRLYLHDNSIALMILYLMYL